MQQKSQSERLGIEPIPKLLISLSIPAMVGMFVMALYNIVDTIFISRAVGITGVAGVTIAFPIMMIIMALSAAIGVGGASVISRRLGEKREHDANRVFGNMILLVSCISLAAFICAVTVLNPLLRLFGATTEIISYSYDYMFPFMMGTVFFSFGFATNNIIRSEGNAKFAMITMIIPSVLNIILDPIFIFGLDLGVRGAAYATVLSQATVTIVILWYFLSGKSSLTIRWSELVPSFSVIKEILMVGFPAFMQQAAGSLMVVSINTMLIRYGSEFYVGIFGIVQRISMFMLMPLIGIMQGMQPIVGYNYGAKNYTRLKEAVLLGLKAATILSTFIFIVMIIVPNFFVSIFSSDANVIKAGSEALRILFATSFFIGVPVVCGGIYQSLGKVKQALILSLSRQILFLIPLVLILPRFVGVNGVWLAFPISDALAFTLALYLLYRDRSLILREDDIEDSKKSLA